MTEQNKYSIFDTFMELESEPEHRTWPKRSGGDIHRFCEALDEVVRLPEFTADEMANHMRSKINLTAEDRDSYWAKAIDVYRDKAQAIAEFIQYSKVAGRPI